MTVEKAGGYISELEFNTGEKVQINRNDILNRSFVTCFLAKKARSDLSI